MVTVSFNEMILLIAVSPKLIPCAFCPLVAIAELSFSDNTSVDSISNGTLRDSLLPPESSIKDIPCAWVPTVDSAALSRRVIELKKGPPAAIASALLPPVVTRASSCNSTLLPLPLATMPEEKVPAVSIDAECRMVTLLPEPPATTANALFPLVEIEAAPSSVTLLPEPARYIPRAPNLTVEIEEVSSNVTELALDLMPNPGTIRGSSGFGPMASKYMPSPEARAEVVDINAEPFKVMALPFESKPNEIPFLPSNNRSRILRASSLSSSIEILAPSFRVIVTLSTLLPGIKRRNPPSETIGSDTPIQVTTSPVAGLGMSQAAGAGVARTMVNPSKPTRPAAPLSLDFKRILRALLTTDPDVVYSSALNVQGRDQLPAVQAL